jgi:hypothetical protein
LNAGKGIFVILCFVLGVSVQVTKDPSVNLCIISCELDCCLVKFIENSRKFQKL